MIKDMDNFLEQLQNTSIPTNIPSMDFYDNHIKDNPFYKKQEEYFEYLDEISDLYYEAKEEEEIEKYLNNEIEENNKYIKALKYRYDNRKEDLDENYTYMYEIYWELKYIGYYARRQILKSEYIDGLIERIENNIDIAETAEHIYSYNIDVDFHNLIKDHLEEIKFHVDFYEFDHIAIVNDKFIEDHFESKDKQYKNNRAKQFKRKNNSVEDYKKLFDSYEYRTKKINKSDIAQILGVSKAAVSQFCKRHEIN